jgi:hypothetical protein
MKAGLHQEPDVMAFFLEDPTLHRLLVLLLTMVLCLTAGRPFAAEKEPVSDRTQKQVRDAIDIRQATQEAEEHWRKERDRLAAEFEGLQQEQDWLKLYQEELQHRIAATRERIAAKEQQLADSEQIAAQVDPFLLETVANLQKAVADDLPFLTAERGQRLHRLNRLMEEPEVPFSEKFRKVMEALLIEAEYGHTIEVLQQTIDLGDHGTLVNVFRLGRISLFYQTLDRKSCGHYDVAAGGWRPLPGRFNHAISTAIEIGSRRRPVELISLPLGRITVQ